MYYLYCFLLINDFFLPTGLWNWDKFVSTVIFLQKHYFIHASFSLDSEIFLRSKQKVHSHVAQLKKKDNTLTGSDEEAANELSSFFCKSDTDGP